MRRGQRCGRKHRQESVGGQGGTTNVRLRKRDSNALVAHVATWRSVVTFGQNEVSGVAVRKGNVEEMGAR